MHQSSRLQQTRRNACAWLSGLALLAYVPMGARAQSALDGFDPNANGPIRVAVVQPDGKVLIGGDFSSLSPNGGPAVARKFIARLNTDGTVDAGFNPNANSFVYAIALQADGKILVGGAFFGANSIGGQARNRIARLDPTSGLADPWDPNANTEVYALAVQADGKILVGGNFQTAFGGNTIGGAVRNCIARLDPVNGVADSFNPNANNAVRSIAVQADGKILVGGTFDQGLSVITIGGQTRNSIARLDPTTGAADSFNPNANGDVLSIALPADGKIVVGGEFNVIGGLTRNFIARLDPGTGAADSFNPNANGVVHSVVIQADGKILAGGEFNGTNSIGVQSRNRIARLDPANGLADSFNPNASGIVRCIAQQPDGKIVVGGDFNGANSMSAHTRNRIARLEMDGRLDQTLDLGTLGGTGPEIEAIAVQPDGKILLVGVFNSVLGVTRNNIARLNTDGTLDTAFDPNASGNITAVAVQPDGKIIVGGSFMAIGGKNRNFLARLDPVTGIADSWDPNPDASVFSIALQADGKILVGGSFNGTNSIGVQNRNRLARLDPVTGLADSWTPNCDGLVYRLAVQADAKILVCGFLTNVGGQMRNHIARLDPITGLADSWNPNPNGTVVGTIVVQPDGKILVGGVFSNIGGQNRIFIARLDPGSAAADSFDAIMSGGGVSTLALQADGKVIAVGDFTTCGPHVHSNLARLDPTTGLADSFEAHANSNRTFALAIAADGKLLVGGVFSGLNSIGGQTRNCFARLTNDTGALQNVAATQNTLTWTRGGSSPQFEQVTFESSTDNVSYNFLGNATASGSNWVLTGLNLPTGQNIYIRARGYYGSGDDTSSESLTESVRNFVLTAAPPSPTPTATPTSTPGASATPTASPTATATATPTPTPPTTLANVSTRLPVLTGDNALIGGFIVTGTQPKKVIIRAIGPSLNLPGQLSNPTLELYQGSTLLASNDDWQNQPDADRQAVIDSTIAPSNDLESALVRTLPANGTGYTAIVRGANGDTGIGVVEAYDLDRTVDSKLANISTRGFVQTDPNILIA